MIFIQQYGARRTGTHYIQNLIEYNFVNVLVMSGFPNGLAGKHHKPRDPEGYKKAFFPNWPSVDVMVKEIFEGLCESNEELFKELARATLSEQIINLVIVKNPYSWFESLYRWTKNCNEEAKSYPLRAAMLSQKKDFKLTDELVYKEIISYNERYRAWIDTADCLIKYEDLLNKATRNKFLESLEERYNLIRNSKELIDITFGSDPMPIKNKLINPDWDYSDYYLNEKYLTNLSQNTVDVITEAVDWGLLEPLGYGRQKKQNNP